MAVSVSKIVDQVNAKIVEGGQDVINTARLVGSVQALESRYSVANLASLPPAADNTGRFIYVEDIGAYRYSDGTQWTNDYDTTLTTISSDIFSWGASCNGGLGDGTTVSKCSPVQEFCSSTNWCQVSLGCAHAAAIKTSGEIWTWGWNNGFMLGDGTATDRCSPVREFCSATDWCQVSSGRFHSTAIKTSGQLWAWGIGNTAQLGDGTITNRCSPVREFCSATDWCLSSANYRQSFAIKTSGQLWAWGLNTSAALGDGTTTNKCSPVREFCSATDWCQIGPGRDHTAAIKTSGQLWAWGLNTPGRLGDGTTTAKCSPVREFCSATDWCQVSAGCYQTLAIKTSGQLWAWGCASTGRLGDGTTTNKCSPVREFCSATDWCGVSTYISSAAIKTSGQIWTWGGNVCGILGDGTVTPRCSPVREISSSTNWCQLGVSKFNVAAIKTTFKGFNEP